MIEGLYYKPFSYCPHKKIDFSSPITELVIPLNLNFLEHLLFLEDFLKTTSE
jgi:hypothetical protein